jgi:hypothetical protein
MANHVEHHTEFWSNHGGGATINRLAKQKYAGVHRDSIPPTAFTGVARLVKQARQANLGKDRDDIDPMSFPDGNARRSKQARQANLGKDRDDIDPSSLPAGAPRRSKQARQANLGKDRDDIDPSSLPAGAPRRSKAARQANLGKDRDEIDPLSFDGAARRSKAARQANLGKDRDEIDPMSLPAGASKRSKQDRQNNLDVCYLDRTSSSSKNSNAIAAANAKVASLERAGYTVGISDLPGTTTTAYSVKEAYHILWGNANDTDDTGSSSSKANYLILEAFERSRQNMHGGGFTKWSQAHGMRICFGEKKLDGSSPSFGPYFEGGSVIHACSSCPKTYKDAKGLGKHKKTKGH